MKDHHGGTETRRRNPRAVAIAAGLLLFLAGCGGDARVEMAAADALEAAAGQIQVGLLEYHREVRSADDTREAAVTGAFIERIMRDAADKDKCRGHGQQFAAALAKIRGDRDTENLRAGNFAADLGVILETARGLRRIGVESLTIQDEVRRYLLSYIDARKKASGLAAAGGLPGVRAPTSSAPAFSLGEPPQPSGKTSAAGGSGEECPLTELMNRGFEMIGRK